MGGGAAVNQTTQGYCATPVADMVKGLEITMLMNSAACYLKLPPPPAANASAPAR